MVRIKLSSVYTLYFIRTNLLFFGQASADPEGRQGVRTPLENYKLYGFL